MVSSRKLIVSIVPKLHKTLNANLVKPGNHTICSISERMRVAFTLSKAIL